METEYGGHDPQLVDELAAFYLEKAYSSGDPPFNDEAWLKGCRQALMRENSPEQIERKADGVRARLSGQRITGWREVRGTHGIDHVHDPQGTDTPPWL